MSRHPSAEAERPDDEDGWQDWPPCAEIGLPTPLINAVVGRYVPRAQETIPRGRDAKSSRD
jgi:hypothetical protein